MKPHNRSSSPAESFRKYCPDVALIAGGLLYYSSYVSLVPFNPYDEGYLLYIAHAFSQGQAPYEDIRLFSYLPGLFYLFTVIMKFSGPDVFWPRVAMLVGLSITPWLLYRTSLRFTGRTLAFAVAIVVLLVPGPWYKFYVGLIGVASICCCLGMLITPSASWGAAMGMVLAGAFLMRMDAAIAATGLLVAVGVLGKWSLGSSRALPLKPFVWAVATATVILAPWMAWLAAKGLLWDHLLQWWNFIPRMVARTTIYYKLPAPSVASLLGLDRAAADAWMFYGSLVPVVTLALMAIAKVVRRPVPGPDRLEAAALILVVLWSLANLPQYLVERPSVHHLTHRAFCFFLPLAIVLQQSLDWSRERTNSLYKAAGIAVAAFLWVYSMAFVVKHEVLGQGGSAGVIRTPVTWQRLSNGMSFPEATGAHTAELVQHILNNSDKNDRVASLPYMPGVNFLAQRLMPNREVYLLPHAMGLGVEEDFIASLSRWPVQFVVYAPRFVAAPGQSNLIENFAPRVHTYLMRNYDKVMERKAVGLLARRGHQPSHMKKQVREPVAVRIFHEPWFSVATTCIQSRKGSR